MKTCVLIFQFLWIFAVCYILFYKYYMWCVAFYTCDKKKNSNSQFQRVALQLCMSAGSLVSLASPWIIRIKISRSNFEICPTCSRDVKSKFSRLHLGCVFIHLIRNPSCHLSARLTILFLPPRLFFNFPCVKYEGWQSLGERIA